MKRLQESFIEEELKKNDLFTLDETLRSLSKWGQGGNQLNLLQKFSQHPYVSSSCMKQKKGISNTKFNQTAVFFLET